jgi:hypothetical protein
MDYKKVEALIGKELVDEDVKVFLDETGIKYPKKDTIGAGAGDWDFWLIGKKAGIELLFSIDILNHKYKAKQAHRKDIFTPIFEAVRFMKNTCFALPFGINYSSKLDELKEKLGESVLSETIYPAYIWNVMLGADREIELHANYRIDKERVWDIWINIKTFKELFRLYHTQYGETIESALNARYVYDEEERKNAKRASTRINKAANARLVKENLFFILWATDNSYLYLGRDFERDVDKLRKRETDIIAFAA